MNEVSWDYLPGCTLYFCRFQLNGDVFLSDGASDEVWGTGDRDADDYDVSMTEAGSSGHYVGDFDSVPNIEDGIYRVVIYLQAGANPADSDAAIASGQIEWDGSAETQPPSIGAPGPITTELTIQEKFTIDGVLTDVTSVKLSDPTGAFGVKRNDTDAVVVADGTAMTKVSTGVYRHTFTEPALGLVYTYWVEWEYDGETHRDEHTIAGATAEAGLCTLIDVKNRLGETGTDHDATLARLILGLTAICEGYVNRPLILNTADATEYYAACGELLQLTRYPVVAITSIKQAVDYNFDDADALVADEGYRLINNGVTGIVRGIYGTWFDTPDGIEVIYRGGYCIAGRTPGEGETAMPADLREAAIEQVTFLFKRRDDLGLSAVGFEGGSINKFSAIDLLPQVKKILDNYKIPSL